MVHGTLFSLLSLAAAAAATPRVIPPPLHVPITRRSSHRNISLEHYANHADSIRQKYGIPTRANSTLVNRAGQTVAVSIIDQVCICSTAHHPTPPYTMALSASRLVVPR